MLGDYAPYEEEYRQFVYEHYLTLDSETEAFIRSFIADNELDANDPDILRKVAECIQNSAVYNLAYDRRMDDEENVIMAFLSTYREGVCRHYASAATVVFRALGIPARYTVGYTVEVKANTKTDITTPGHAWVEVYLDGIGWVPIEVTGSMAGDDPGQPGQPDQPDERVPVQVFPYQASKYYDGESMTFSEEYVILSDIDGVEVRLIPRVAFTSVTSITIADMNAHLEEYFEWEILVNGEDRSDEYTIVFFAPATLGGDEYVSLEIKPRQIELTSDSRTKVFDGSELTAPNIMVSKGTLANGDVLYGEAIGILTEVGAQLNEFGWRQIINAWGEDVTDNYFIICNPGTLCFEQPPEAA